MQSVNNSKVLINYFVSVRTNSDLENINKVVNKQWFLSNVN